jgi:SAM-dependent methyltransferase
MRCTSPGRKTQERQRSRDKLKKYLHGTGIEIGALHKPPHLRDWKVSKLIHVDRLSMEEQRGHSPELMNISPLVSEIITHGTNLEKVENVSLDFIAANHLIEHTADLLGSLQYWYRRLRPIGIICQLD